MISGGGRCRYNRGEGRGSAGLRGGYPHTHTHTHTHMYAPRHAARKRGTTLYCAYAAFTAWNFTRLNSALHIPFPVCENYV